jgi:hypothetical protein
MVELYTTYLIEGTSNKGRAFTQIINITWNRYQVPQRQAQAISMIHQQNHLDHTFLITFLKEGNKTTKSIYESQFPSHGIR